MDALTLDTDLVEQVERLQKVFQDNSWKLGFAESCTGGLVSAILTSRPGVSKFFEGSIISYAGRVKEKSLHVPKHLIQTMGEVSLPVALAMAKGARIELGVDWAVSITGIAGPAGGSPDKPVGTVCLAVCGPGVERSVQKQFSGTTRESIQWATAKYAFELLWEAIHQ